MLFLLIANLLIRGRRSRDRLVLDLQLPMQSVPITTNAVSSNPSQARCTTLCDKVCQ
jgi:hypothetical protein